MWWSWTAARSTRASTPLQALSTTYGIDIMEDNVAECRERLLEAAGHPDGGEVWVERNIRCADALKVSTEELWPEPADPAS